MIEDGGKSDFHYGKDWQIMGQPPVKVDRVLRSGDTVRLGEVIRTGYNTPGHTRDLRRGALRFLKAARHITSCFRTAPISIPAYLSEIMSSKSLKSSGSNEPAHRPAEPVATNQFFA